MRKGISIIFLILYYVSLPTYSYPIELTSRTPAEKLANAKNVVVKEDVDLSEARLVLNNDAKLVFKGGSISNGEVVLKNTELCGNVRLLCRVVGNIKNKSVYVDWFLPQNDLDVLYRHGVFNLKGYEKLIFRQSEYVSGVRGKNKGIRFNNVVVDGNGAVIRAKEGGSTFNSLLVFSECNNILIKNLVLKGKEIQSNEEGARHNLCLNKCNNTTIENVVSYNAFTDGLYIRKCNDVKVLRFAAYRSGRQGCSITAGNDIRLTKCIFDASYRVAPKAGMDIEPNYETDVVDNIKISDCVFTNNSSSGLTIKLRRREKAATCNITIKNCYFDGNGTNISVASAPYSGVGSIDISRCTLRNSKWVSFQSKCYSATRTPRVKFHDSTLENANMNAGTDVREQAAFISVHNISSHPLSGNYGNVELYSLTIKQNKNLIKNIKRAINVYPDVKYEVEDVLISNISFDFEEREGGTRLMYVPKNRVKSVKVK